MKQRQVLSKLEKVKHDRFKLRSNLKIKRKKSVSALSGCKYLFLLFFLGVGPLGHLLHRGPLKGQWFKVFMLKIVPPVVRVQKV